MTDMAGTTRAGGIGIGPRRPNTTQLLLAAAAILAQSAASAGVRLENHFAPRIDRTDQGETLRFEIQVTNDTATAIQLQSLRIRNAASDAPALILAGDALKNTSALMRPGCDQDHGVLAPQGNCVLYIDSPLKAGETPGTLDAALDYMAGGQQAGTALKLKVAGAQAPVIGPPLGGGIWVAVHSPDWPRGHRRVFYPSGDNEVLPGRFAIDFVKVSTNGATSKGNPDKPADTIGYGDPVLAVATGRIAAVRDGMPESPSIQKNGAHGASQAAGNYIVLALDSGEFATYEHLLPGSVRVHAGQAVQRGDIIAALGFTGDSTGPHLHFHISTTADPVAGEGLPYVFDRYTLLGDYPNIGDLGKKHWRGGDPLEVRQKRPAANTVLSF